MGWGHAGELMVGDLSSTTSIIEQSLAGAVQGVRTCIEENFNLHRPVELTFFPQGG